MSKLDQEAMREAVEQFMASVVGSGFDREALDDAINAYRQAECKPFKDAPRDGTVVEVIDASSNQPYWVTIFYGESEKLWYEYPATEDCWPHESCLKWWTHYRIPFNPEEG